MNVTIDIVLLRQLVEAAKGHLQEMEARLGEPASDVEQAERELYALDDAVMAGMALLQQHETSEA